MSVQRSGGVGHHNRTPPRQASQLADNTYFPHFRQETSVHVQRLQRINARVAEAAYGVALQDAKRALTAIDPNERVELRANAATATAICRSAQLVAGVG